MEIHPLLQSAVATLIAVGWKVAGALVLWLVGRWLIAFAVRLLSRALAAQQLDATLSRYFQTGLSVLLNIALVVALLGFFGVETTTFAALLAAGGVAIGVAWGGLLANFAAGAFLIFLRPFKVGDFVSAAGVTGTVESIGLFGTTFNTPDNVLTIVGNNKIFSETIQNFSANPYRRVDLTATISNSVDHGAAMRLLAERVARIPNVLGKPAPQVDVLQFTAAGPLLCVRPCCRNEDYWQVYFDTNRTIREAFGEAGFPAAMPSYSVTGLPPGAPNPSAR
ncbi:MAG TPA: mechanosensitive ion channel family protein [Vicinamibacterales bacterium]|jgi:small conductance mechanosensitive channel